MRMTVAADAPVDQLAYALDMNVLEGLEGVVGVHLPCVVDDYVGASSQLVVNAHLRALVDFLRTWL